MQQANPAAADLLRLCAFLHPDAIPEEIMTEGASELGPVLEPVAGDPLEWNAAIEALRNYSLIRRDPEARTLTIHRLVQAVLKDGMDESIQRQWAERAVQAVNEAFPWVEYTSWPRCERLLPHAFACRYLIEQWGIESDKVGRLLNHTALYLGDRARYHEAESLLQQALAVGEKALGAEHPVVAIRLNNLANLYREQGKYEQAEPLYQRAIAIGEKTLGAEHPNVAIRLNNLAVLYSEQGKYTQAELLYQRAITIGEKTLGAEHPDVAMRYNNLANLYYFQGKYEQAELLYQRAIAIDEKALGSEHPGLATDLENYARLLRKTNREAEAAKLEARAEAIRMRHAQQNPTSE